MKREIVNAINSDIKRGVYNNFPWLKSRLTYIGKKLISSIYTHDIVLTPGEIETLVENEYMEYNKVKELS